MKNDLHSHAHAHIFTPSMMSHDFKKVLMSTPGKHMPSKLGDHSMLGYDDTYFDS